MKKAFCVFLIVMAFAYVFVSSKTLETKGREAGMGDRTKYYYEFHWERFLDTLKSLSAKARQTLESALKKTIR